MITTTAQQSDKGNRMRRMFIVLRFHDGTKTYVAPVPGVQCGNSFLSKTADEMMSGVSRADTVRVGDSPTADAKPIVTATPIDENNQPVSGC